MSNMEQRLITLRAHGGEFYNFFNTPGSIDSLASFLSHGWIVKDMQINKEQESGWVLLEKQNE